MDDDEIYYCDCCHTIRTAFYHEINRGRCHECWSQLSVYESDEVFNDESEVEMDIQHEIENCQCLVIEAQRNIGTHVETEYTPCSAHEAELWTVLAARSFGYAMIVADLATYDAAREHVEELKRRHPGVRYGGMDPFGMVQSNFIKPAAELADRWASFCGEDASWVKKMRRFHELGGLVRDNGGAPRPKGVVRLDFDLYRPNGMKLPCDNRLKDIRKAIATLETESQDSGVPA